MTAKRKRNPDYLPPQPLMAAEVREFVATMPEPSQVSEKLSRLLRAAYEKGVSDEISRRRSSYANLPHTGADE